MESLQSIERQALALPEIDRAQLVKRLLTSLEPAPDKHAEDAWDETISSRVREIREGRAEGRPLDDVLREAKAKYS